MLAFQAGDEAAFEALVASYQGHVFSLLRRILGPAAVVEDLAQEVFVRVWRVRERYRPEGRFSTFLYRVTWNLALNAIRDGKRHRALRLVDREDGAPVDPPDRGGPAPWAAHDQGVWAERVREALQELPENQRAALVLQHYDGLGLEEVGAVLGISAKAAKSLCHRARENLRRILEPYREERDDG